MNNSQATAVQNISLHVMVVDHKLMSRAIVHCGISYSSSITEIEKQWYN